MQTAAQTQPQYAETLSALGAQCAQCINVAQQVRSKLHSGISAADLTPLLRQSAAVTRLQQGIHALSQHSHKKRARKYANSLSKWASCWLWRKAAIKF